MKNTLLTKNEILRQLENDAERKELYERLPEEWEEKFLDFCTGMKGIPLLYDPFFKKIFDPEIRPERLSRLLSLILGFNLKVRRVLPNEGMRILEEGSLLIMDVVVEMEDGSIANVEIQKIPYRFPGERAACYSADLLLRQYSRVKNEKGKVFSYRDIKKVYTIVILESSSSPFHIFPDTYMHRSQQRFDSGLEVELLQEYVFIALDRFREIKQNKIEDELDAWMHLLSSDNLGVLLRIAKIYPYFREIYNEIEAFRQDIGGVLCMFSEALKILDKNTVQLMIDEMKEEIERKDNNLEEQGNELKRMSIELRKRDVAIKDQATELEKKATELREKDVEIKDQAAELAAQTAQINWQQKRIKELEEQLRSI